MPHLGGQAVLDGVMIRSPKGFAVAVRRPDGDIAVRERAWSSLWPDLPCLRWPGVRGAVALVEALHHGLSALLFSAQQLLPAPPSSAAVAARPFSRSAVGIGMVATSVAFALGLFVAAPHFLTFSLGAGGSAFHLVDGAIRVAVVLGYLWAVSLTAPIQRVFQCHGAEHKVVWAYEANAPLTVQSARRFPTAHPRCGTSFLFMVVALSVAAHVCVLPLVPRLHEGALAQQLFIVVVKVALALPIAAASYELQRWSSRPSCPRVVRWLARPGLWLQRFTALEPTDAQLEVALLALERCVAHEQGRAKVEGVFLYPSLEALEAA